MSNAFRLVRCPKCRKILPEFPNIPLYKCGGCGAILQAKKHKNEIKGSVQRAQETDPIQKHEPNSVSSCSSPEGERSVIESSPGSDARGEQFSSGSHKSEKPVDSNVSDEHSQLTKPNPLLTNELAVHGECQRLLEKDAGLHSTVPLNYSSENPHDKPSNELSDCVYSSHEKEDSPSEISISTKQFEERFVTSENEIEDSHGVLAAEEKCTCEPHSLDQHITHFSADKHLMDVVLERQNIGEYTNKTEDSHGVLAKEERCSGEPQSLDYLEATSSLESEPLKLVVTKKKQNNGNEIGKYTHEKGDSQGELSEEGTQSNESLSCNEPATHFSVSEPLKSDEGNEPSAEDKTHSKVDESHYFSRKNDRMRENAFSDQIEENSRKRETENEDSSSIKDFYKVEISSLVSEEYNVADENGRSNLENPSGSEKGKEITAVRGPLSRSIVFAPLSPDDKYLKESHEVGPSFHNISSEEMLDTSPRNPIVPSAPLSSDDIYLEDSNEVGPSFHHTSSEEMLDNLPSNPIVPIAPLSSDDIYLEESHEVGPSFHLISSEEMLDILPSNIIVPIAPLSSGDIYLEDSEEVGPNFHRIRSEEMLDILPSNPIVPIAPLSSGDIYLEDSQEVGPSFNSISSEEMLATLPINSRVPIAPHLPDDIYLEFHEVGPSFHRISSEEMLDTLPINPRVSITSMSKSPTKRYYSGHESESTYGGGEESSAQVSHLYSRKFMGAGTMNTNRSRKKDVFRVKNKQNGELKMHNEQFNFISKFKEPNTSSVSERDWRRHELSEPKKQNRPIRTSMTAKNNEPISRSSFMARSSQPFLGNGSPANSTHNVVWHSGEFRQPDTMAGSDPEKMALLRKVYELEDKLNRTHMSKKMTVERIPQQEIPTIGYNDDPATGINSYEDFIYSEHHNSHPQGVGQANQPRSSRLGFSGESLCRNHIDCRCSHCFQQDLHFSPKLSSHGIHCRHAAPQRHDYDNIYPSYSPSPQHYTSSEFSHEIQTDNQKHEHETEMSYLREKHRVMKKHLRPVSGGAPIICCYHCSELLQLPADFLLFKRRCHQLRCNSCNMILKFSLQKDSHLVPYVFKIQAPSPSGVIMDDLSNIADRKTLASTSHAKTPQDAGPVSFSDDFEPPFSRNGSTESGPSVPSSLSILKNLSGGEPSSNHTFQAMNDRKMKTVMEIYQEVNESSRRKIEAAGPSSSRPTWGKPSTEIEELPATSGPPLHRLMGYESPRQVLLARSEDESDDGMGYYMYPHGHEEQICKQ